MIKAVFPHLLLPSQVEVTNPELYMYDGEVIAKAEEMGKPGLVSIKQKQVRFTCNCSRYLWGV